MRFTLKEMTAELTHGQVVSVELTGAVLNTDGERVATAEIPDSFKADHFQSSYPALVAGEDSIEVVTYVEVRGKSDYSIQQATATPGGIIAKSDVGAALTDLGVGFGLYQFNQAAVKSGKKAILGCEFYLRREGGDKYDYDRLVLLAKNREGYLSLCKLITLGASRVKASDVKSKVKPHIALSDLAGVDAGNLIALSAYDDGAVNRYLWQRNAEGDAKAQEYVRELTSYVAPEDVYLEIQYQKDTDGWLEDDFAIRESITDLAERCGVKLVLTNNYHMIDGGADNMEALHVLQALGQKKSLDDDPELIQGRELYVHTSAEMAARNYPVALLDATIEIYNKCQAYDLYSKANFMPNFLTPAEFKDATEYFRYVSRKGLASRMGVGSYDEVAPEYKERLEEEMGLIETMGFVGYFLITADFISYAKRNYSAYDDATVARWTAFIAEHGYDPAPIAIGPSRGSAGGSLVSYAMAITDVDPLRYGLLFERFLNIERVSMPDIDTDIPDNKRQEVIHYVQSYYNVSENPVESRVAGIGVFGTYKIKAVLKAVVRALYKNPGFGDQLANLAADPTMSFDDYLELPEVMKLMAEDRRMQRVARIAPKLMNLVSNLSQHAAGYVIAPSPVTDYLPTTFVHNTDTNRMEQITAYTYVEAIGLLKMDFLGLRGMSVIQDTIDDINADTGQSMTIDSILKEAITDLDTYRTLAQGFNYDIFQLGSDGMKDMIVRVLADVNSPGAEARAASGDYFSRLIAGISIYRPGPMAFLDEFIDNALNPENMVFAVPEIEDLLRQSYGLLIYQESIMALFRVIAGTSLGRADILRRAISKKDPVVLAEQKSLFIYGSEEEGIPGGIKNTGRSVAELEDLWSNIEAFAAYGFNKSHAAGYAHISIIMAWLSHHYPAYFACSNLNHPQNTEATRNLLAYYKRKGLKTIPADINLSKNRFSVSNGNIMFGMDGIKYLSSNAPRIYAEREANGEFKDLLDLVSRIAEAKIDVTKQSIEALIYSGALDSLPLSREEKISAIPRIADVLSLLKKEERTVFTEVPGFFDTYVKSAAPRSVTDKELLQKEYDYTGFYISGHPADAFAQLTESYDNYHTIEDLAPSQRNLTILGIIKSSHRIMTRTNKAMAFFTLEDSTAALEATVFPEEFSDFGRLIYKGKVVLVNGYTQDSGKFIVTSIKDAEHVKLATEIDHIQLKLSDDKSAAAKQLQTIISKMADALPYTQQVKLSYVFDGRELFQTKDIKSLTLAFDNETIEFVKSVVGRDNLNIIWRSRLV